MRAALILTSALALSACGTTTTPQAVLRAPVPVVVTQDVRTALASYQAALGVAEVALVGNPRLSARVQALAALAAPYVAAVHAGTSMAENAPSLAALAAQRLIEGAPFITAVPNGRTGG